MFWYMFGLVFSVGIGSLVCLCEPKRPVCSIVFGCLGYFLCRWQAYYYQFETPISSWYAGGFIFLMMVTVLGFVVYKTIMANSIFAVKIELSDVDEMDMS